MITCILTIEVIRYNVVVVDQDIIFINKFQGGWEVKGRELKLPLGWYLINTKVGRVVQGSELELPSGWIL